MKRERERERERKIIIIENSIVAIPKSADIWMTIYELADLFECFTSKVNANIRAILKTGVLDERTVCRTHHFKDGSFVEQYNMEMIIALSFRIKSRNADAFRECVMKRIIRHDAMTTLLFPLQNSMLN